MKLRPYIALMRVDHWAKNVLVLPGVVGALLMEPGSRSWAVVPQALLGLAALCLICSSSYVINEILDAKQDRHHPKKQTRALVSGAAQPRWAFVLYILLSTLAFLCASFVARSFLWIIVTWFFMALLYNCPPVRTKELPYLDVLSEALNNPLRLAAGWFAISPLTAPPSSLAIAYWMLGAFLMSAKRLAEYRMIGDPLQAAKYRSSFRYYTEEHLVTAMLSYASGFMFFVAVIVVKYHVELILSAPFLMAYLAYYTWLSYQPDSPTQAPERLFRRPSMIAMSACLALVLIGLALLRIPSLESWLGIEGIGW